VSLDYRDVFTDRLRQARAARGLTQRELAKLLDISHATVGHYEAGSREPSLHVLTNLARLLDTSPDWLLGFPYGKPPKPRKNS
jgi:transcriptional regulator with XRE-family HTH domain